MSFLILLNLLMFRFRIRGSVEGAWAPDMGSGGGSPEEGAHREPGICSGVPPSLCWDGRIAHAKMQRLLGTCDGSWEEH